MNRFTLSSAVVGLALACVVTAGPAPWAAAQGPSRIVVQRPAAAPVLTPELKAFAEECDTLRRGTILRLEASLRGLKSGHTVTADNPGTIRQTEEDLDALRSGRRMIVPALRYPPRVGQIGRLPGGGAYVEQILGPKEALVRCSFRVSVVVTRDQRSVGEVVRQRPLFKMSGQPTAEWGESSDVALDGTFQIVGTERYQTEDGRTSTVQVLKPFDIRPIEEYLRRQAAK